MLLVTPASSFSKFSGKIPRADREASEEAVERALSGAFRPAFELKGRLLSVRLDCGCDEAGEAGITYRQAMIDL